MDIRYAAGLFDGEGMVRIGRWAKPDSTHVRYQIRVTIGMSHRPVIESLHKQFGGSLHNNRHDLRNPKNRIQFNWIASSQAAVKFLRKVLPHLVVKREEAEIAIALQEHIDANRPTLKTREALFAYRENLYQRITALKKRAYPPLTT